MIKCLVIQKQLDNNHSQFVGSLCYIHHITQFITQPIGLTRAFVTLAFTQLVQYPRENTPTLFCKKSRLIRGLGV